MSTASLLNKRYLILDNDTIFTAQFIRIIEDAGVKVVRTSLHAPNMNAFAERFVLTVKSECLSKLILFGYSHLERCLAEFTAHYNSERPHQGLSNELIHGGADGGDGDVVVSERLGGLLRSYHRAA